MSTATSHGNRKALVARLEPGDGLIVGSRRPGLVLQAVARRMLRRASLRRIGAGPFYQFTLKH